MALEEGDRLLEQLGATPLVERTVVGVDAEAVTVEAPDGTTDRVPARTVIWAAGVTAAREVAGAALMDRGRRVRTGHSDRPVERYLPPILAFA